MHAAIHSLDLTHLWHPTAHSPGRWRLPSALLVLLSASATGFTLLFLFQRKLFGLAALMSTIDLFAFRRYDLQIACRSLPRSVVLQGAARKSD
jgi:hypothetical protein